MPITMNDLTISPSGIDFETLLADWEWAMPEPLRPVLLTAMGDASTQYTAPSANAFPMASVSHRSSL
jgi:hypothetical protein